MTHATLASGMKDWSPTDWGVFFTVVGGFITITLTPAVLLIMSKIAGLRQNTLASLKQNSDETSKNTDRIYDLAKSTPTAPPMIVAPVAPQTPATAPGNIPVVEAPVTVVEHKQ